MLMSFMLKSHLLSKRLTPDEVNALLTPLSVDNSLQLTLYNFMSAGLAFNIADSKLEKRSIKASIRPLVVADVGLSLRAAQLYKSMNDSVRTEFYNSFGSLLKATSSD